MEKQILKNLWFWVVVILLTGIFFFYLRFNAASPSNRPSVWPLGGIPPNYARIVIGFENGAGRVFEGAVSSKTTLLEALYSASSAGGLNFRYSIDKNGRFSLLVLDHIIPAGKEWHFYLNGKEIKTAEINNTTVKPGDLINVKPK